MQAIQLVMNCSQDKYFRDFFCAPYSATVSVSPVPPMSSLALKI